VILHVSGVLDILTLYSMISIGDILTEDREISVACIKANIVSGIANIKAAISDVSDRKNQLCIGDPYVSRITIDCLHSSIIQL